MMRPLDRVRIGATVLAVVVLLAIVGYRLAGWDWLDAIYMVVITLSTIGYREVGPMTPAVTLLTIALIVCGLTAFTYTAGGLLRMMAEGEIQRMLGTRREERELLQTADHTVICGFGRIGQILAAELQRLSRPIVVIESDATRAAEGRGRGFLVVEGDATEEALLIQAGVERAKNLVTALPSDAANVFITLTARNLNRGLQIIARGESPSTEKKLLQAGADRVVLPAVAGAARIATMLTRPSVIELLELAAGQSKIDVEIDEFVLPAGSRLIGQVVGQIEQSFGRSLLVLAVKRASGAMQFNPAADFQFAAGDVLIFMAKLSDISRFRAAFGLAEADGDARVE